jgi:hypothetical protein
MSRPITAVHVDIARFILEVSALSADSAEKWLRDLARCLAMRDPAIHAYGAHLLAEVDEYRKAELKRKSERKQGFIPRNPRTSALSADGLPNTDQIRSDQSNTDLREEVPPPAGGSVGGKPKGKTPKAFEQETEAYRLAEFFAKFHVEWARGAKPADSATLQRWAGVFDLMLRRDGRTLDGIGAMLNAIDLEKPSKGSDFLWRKNILSPQTLRDRWNEGKLHKFLPEDPNGR